MNEHLTAEEVSTLSRERMVKILWFVFRIYITENDAIEDMRDCLLHEPRTTEQLMLIRAIAQG
jgi:hypothetical protein